MLVECVASSRPSFSRPSSTDAPWALRRDSYHIGTLVQPASAAGAAISDAPVSIDATFLQKTKWKKTTLTSIENVSHDSRVFRFALEREDQALGLVRIALFVAARSEVSRLTRRARSPPSQPVGHHVFVRARGADGELVQRAYTPVSRQTEKGFIDLLIKLYLPNDKFPLGGRMSACVSTSRRQMSAQAVALTLLLPFLPQLLQQPQGRRHD